MTEKVFPMTLEGKAKLEAELEELKVVKRKEIVKLLVVTVTYQKTLNMNQLKMNKLLLKVVFQH